MRLTRGDLEAYDSRLVALGDAAADDVLQRVNSYIEQFPRASVEDIREFAIECIGNVVSVYGDAASTLAADLYDEMAAASNMRLRSALLDESDISEYIRKEVRYQATKLVAGNLSEFAQACAKAARDRVARRANQTMRINAVRDGLRYARVPLGGESCTFCCMLASRGFVYKSAESAGEGNHYHANCRCKVIPGFDGLTVDGYDPDEWLERWGLFREIDSDKRLTEKARAAAKSAISTDASGLINSRAIIERAAADSYGEKLNRAWERFRKDKTEESYESTMGAMLADIGSAAGIELSGEFMARPDGAELWAVCQITSKQARMLYANGMGKQPDAYIDGELTEIKTPESAKKIRRRLKNGAEQFDNHPGEERHAIVNLLRAPESREVAEEAAFDFVKDGIYETVRVVCP